MQPSGSAAPSAELDPEASQADQDPEVCQPPRLTFLESDRKLWDKVQEAVMAKKLTDAYPGRDGKERILETYLNLIFYGNGSYGIKAAAANYFGIDEPQRPDPVAGGIPGRPAAAAIGL